MWNTFGQTLDRVWKVLESIVCLMNTISDNLHLKW